MSTRISVDYDLISDSFHFLQASVREALISVHSSLDMSQEPAKSVILVLFPPFLSSKIPHGFVERNWTLQFHLQFASNL
jgi:hypothetical protein